MIEYSFDMIMTLMIAIVLLLIGKFIKKRVPVLERFFIPVPVIGGLLFSIFLLIIHQSGKYSFTFDSQLKDLCMMIFFTTIGFSASLDLLKKGGIGVLKFLILSTILVILQDVVGMGLAKLFGLHQYIGLAAGSISLTGGHGNSVALGALLDKVIPNGTVVAIASATYGLVAGCLIGGPVAKKLLQKYQLSSKEIQEENSDDDIEDTVTEKNLFDSVIVIVLSMGIGSLLSVVTKKIGLALPSYIGPMLVAALIRNIIDKSNYDLPLKEISVIGNIALSIFLSIALMTLKLWELSDLAVPLVAILLIQTLLMALFAYFITFRFMGKDYDAAVIATGHCGFGLGASPNAMANMEAFTNVNGYSSKAFFIVPLVGALFIDFVNVIVVTFFIGIFA